MLVRAIPLVLVAAAVGMIIPMNDQRGRDAFVTVLPIIIPLILGALGFGLHLGIKRQRAVFENYVLRVEDSGVTREQGNTPTLHLAKEEIREIVKTSAGAFIVKGKSALNMIIVPAQIENPDVVEEQLLRLAHINTKPVGT